MPRRKRNRKTKNPTADHRLHGRHVDGDNSLGNPDAVRSCSAEQSFSHSNSNGTPLRLISAEAHTPEPKLQQHFLQIEAIDSVNTTPVNRNRSLHRDRKNSSRKLCITNLNVLFDSNHLIQSTFDEKDSSSSFVHDSSLPRICETIESPKIETKSTVNVSPLRGDLTGVNVNAHLLQTMHCTPTHSSQLNNEHVFQSITETPRIGHFFSVEETSNDACTVSNHGYNLNNYNPHPLKPATKNLKDTRVNYNPYIQNNDLKGALKTHAGEQFLSAAKEREASVGELSFFTPRLYDFKSASTPIEAAKQNIRNYLKDGTVEESLKNVTKNVEEIEKTSKLSTTLYLSCSPASTTVKQTNLAKEMLSKSLATQTSDQSLSKQFVAKNKRTWKSLTPKLVRYVSHNRLCSRSHSFACQRTQVLSPRNISLHLGECRANTSNNSTCEKIFTRLKRYSRMSARWSMRVLEICAQLGITLKKSLTTMCHLYTLDKSLLSESSTSDNAPCKCAEYRTEIDRLSTTVKVLSEDLLAVKLIMHQQKEYTENMLHLHEDLQKMKEEMGAFNAMKAELEALKEKMGQMSTVLAKSPVIAPPPPAPPVLPPPPPPPLPPPMPLFPAANPAVRQSRTLPRRRDKKGNDDMRPIISLEDILKVKLKKTKVTDRPSPLRRSTQPVVSMDMLKQVKLRPASRPQTPASLTDVSSCCSSNPTSPHSSLTRRSQLARRGRDRGQAEDL